MYRRPCRLTSAAGCSFQVGRVGQRAIAIEKLALVGDADIVPLFDVEKGGDWGFSLVFEGWSDMR
jgi:hypothetical protein